MRVLTRYLVTHTRQHGLRESKPLACGYAVRVELECGHRTLTSYNNADFNERAAAAVASNSSRIPSLPETAHYTTYPCPRGCDNGPTPIEVRRQRGETP